MDRVLKRSMVILFLLLFTAPLYAGEVAVPNFSFEAGSAANGFPVGWPTLFGSAIIGEDIALSDAHASQGDYSLRLTDQRSNNSLGLRSAQIPATPGLVYTASVDVYNETGMAQFYLEFWNSSGQRIDTALVNEHAVGEWKTITAMKTAPAGTTHITMLVYAALSNVGVTYYDNVTLRQDTEATIAKTSPLRELAQEQGSITPIILEPFKHEEIQFSYNPWYTRNEVTFDKYNRPYIRYRTDDLNETGFIHTMRHNRWVELDFTAAIKAAYPNFDAYVKGGGWDGAAVVFDADDDLYTLVRVRLKDNNQYNVLLYSTDYGATFSTYELPNGVTSIEQWVGHNTLNRPPLIGIYAVREAHPATYASYNFFSVLQPIKDRDGLTLPDPVLVSQDSLQPSQHSGGASFAVSSQDKAFITWAEATDPARAYAGAPTYVATYDIASNQIVDKVLLTYGPPVNDSHNTPGIVLDSNGYLHVISGAHGANFYYAQSTKPYSSAEWSKPIAVLQTGFAGSPGGSERGRQTYLSFLADAQDTLHIAFRQWRQNKEPYFDGRLYGSLSYQQKPAGESWSDAKVLVVPPTHTYSIFYHKMNLDRQGRLYLSYNFRTNVGGYNFETPVYQYRTVITSADAGKSWQLATSPDFAAGIYSNAPSYGGQPGRIAGRVVDKQGNPLAGVSFTAGAAQGVTDADGRVTLEDLYVDHTTLAVRKEGYRSWFQQITLPSDTALDVLVELASDSETVVDFGALFNQSLKIGVDSTPTSQGWSLNYNNRLGAGGFTLRFDQDEHYWAIRFEGRAVQPSSQQLTMRATHQDGVVEESLMFDTQWRQYDVEVPTDLKQFNLASSGTAGTIEIRNVRLVK